MFDVAGVGAVPLPRQAVITANQGPDAALAQLRVRTDVFLHVLRHTERIRHGLGETERLGLVAQIVEETDRRCREHTILALLEHVESFRVAEVRVMDDVEPIAQCELDRFGGARMRGELQTQRTRRLGDCANFIGRERRHASGRAHDEIVAGDIDLDDVHAFSKSQAHRASCLDRAVEHHRGRTAPLV